MFQVPSLVQRYSSSGGDKNPVQIRGRSWNLMISNLNEISLSSEFLYFRH